MKVKSTLHAMLLAGMLSGSFVPAFAADDTTSSSVYDFSGFSDTKLMQLSTTLTRTVVSILQLRNSQLLVFSRATSHSSAHTYATRASSTVLTVLSRTHTRSATSG